MKKRFSYSSPRCTWNTNTKPNRRWRLVCSCYWIRLIATNFGLALSQNLCINNKLECLRNGRIATEETETTITISAYPRTHSWHCKQQPLHQYQTQSTMRERFFQLCKLDRTRDRKWALLSSHVTSLITCQTRAHRYDTVPSVKELCCL